jgi:peptide/nickel transport system substrate-binding protein
MRLKRSRAFVALAAVAALGLGACGGGTSSDGDGDGSGAKAEFNAGLENVVNPSDKKGGIVKLGQSGDWGDTVDPGETYYGYSWNFLRTYARSLVMFKPAPGKASEELVPDLAEDLGKPSEGGKTWTYTLRDGVKFEDGTPVTSADVKYAVLRSTDKKTFPSGPAYFEALLDLPEGYDGPFRTPDMNTDQAIETPDDKTVVFHLKQPFAGFDYLAQLAQTAPVPQDKDTGSKYREHVISTGPYKWKTYQAGKLYELERNDQWDPATDPNRQALPDGYQVTLNMEPNDVDNQVIAGSLDADVQAIGVQPAARSRVLQDPALKARSDNPITTRLQYTSINPTVAPLNNIECRKAIMYGMDRTAYQTAYGGPFAGGDIATTLLPPTIPGHQDFDLYPAGDDNKGDLDKAKESLEKCGQPDGFETNMAYRSERPNEKATAEAFQQSLDRVGIKLSLMPLPEGTYFTETCGLPPYVVKNKIGLCVNSWGADWPDGYGFLSQIVDSRVIRPTGGSSNTSVRIPEVDQLLDQALVELDTDKRNKLWGDIDRRVMEEAVIFPGVYGKLLLLRGKNTTNVFVNEALGQYDYLAMGAAQ